MDIKELRKMTVPKLRERAKQVTDLQGVGGMEKEALIEAIAKAEGIAYEAPPKDVTTISSVKHEIRALKKQVEEIHASSKDHAKVHRIRRKIKKLKRRTRQLAHKAGPKEAPQASAPAGASAPATSG
ncbi:MAG: transcription termination factor Rho [Deltaproteobacteria bacterium]|nr:transcription termination factor Rho [Deltaproteobacteria bacterium]